MKEKKYKVKDLTYYIFQILRRPVKWYMNRKFNFNLVKNEAKYDSGPFLITGNHITAFDPIISLVYLKPLVKFVAADANYNNRIKKFFMKIARVIPITKKNSDIVVIRKIINEVESGNSVGVYPEGGRSWHGETDEIIESTAKLIKILGIKVYCQKLKGAYISNPRWGKNINKGRVDITIYKMLSEAEVDKLSVEEILQVLKTHLYHNDYEFQRQEMLEIKGEDRAEYIERLLYVCPNCKQIHTFSSKGNEFLCKFCSAKGRINKYGFIEGDFPYDNLVDWYHYQKDYLMEYLKENEVKPIKLNNVNYKLKRDKVKYDYLSNIKISNENIIIKHQNKEEIIQY